MPAPPAATDGCMRAVTIQSQEEMIAPLQGQITNSQAQQGLQQRTLPACRPMTRGPKKGRLQQRQGLQRASPAVGSLHYAMFLGCPPACSA